MLYAGRSCVSPVRVLKAARRVYSYCGFSAKPRIIRRLYGLGKKKFDSAANAGGGGLVSTVRWSGRNPWMGRGSPLVEIFRTLAILLNLADLASLGQTTWPFRIYAGSKFDQLRSLPWAIAAQFWSVVESRWTVKIWLQNPSTIFWIILRTHKIY